MKVKIITQPYLLFVGNINSISGSLDDYPLVKEATETHRFDDIMVGTIWNFNGECKVYP